MTTRSSRVQKIEPARASQLRIKICGLTRAEDALLACEQGADAVGFIFYHKSPRRIAPEAAAKIAERLPSHVARVGVFVQPSQAELDHALSTLRLDAIQLHGEHDFEMKAAMRQKIAVICAINIAPNFELARLDRYRGRCEALLLDGYRKGTFGGTGKAIDWQMARRASEFGRVILAGGLHPGSVAEAVDIAHPYAVDINSGIEERPGLKNHQKLEQIFTHLKDKRRDWQPAQNKKFPLA